MGEWGKKIIFVYDRGRVENNRYSLLKSGLVTNRLPKKFSQSKKLDWQGVVFYAKYTIRENSYFSELLLRGGCQKRQKALKLLGFLYGGSSIHWPPKPILSSSIFSHLFPFKFFPSISIPIFISNIYLPSIPLLICY